MNNLDRKIIFSDPFSSEFLCRSASSKQARPHELRRKRAMKWKHENGIICVPIVVSLHGFSFYSKRIAKEEKKRRRKRSRRGKRIGKRGRGDQEE